MNLYAGVSAGHDERCEYGHQMDLESHPLPWRGPKSHLPGGTILRRTASGHYNDHSGTALLNADYLPSYCMPSTYSTCKEQCLSVLWLRYFQAATVPSWGQNFQKALTPQCDLFAAFWHCGRLANFGSNRGRCGEVFKIFLCLPAALWCLKALRIGQNCHICACSCLKKPLWHCTATY